MKDRSHLLHKKFTLPASCHRDCKEVVMRELDGDDDIMIAVWLDAQKSEDSGAKDGKESLAIIAAMKREHSESVRCSLVEVDGKPVNLHGVPFAAYDRYRRGTKTALMRFFDDLNGLDSEELGKCVAAGQPVNLEAMNSSAVSAAAQSEG